MKIAGIDLAGSPGNETGLCILEINKKDENEEKFAVTKILHSDTEIIENLKKIDPDITAIDAPLKFSGVNRECDEELRKYGALPVTLRGMNVLAKRGKELAGELKKLNLNYIEIFSTASAKILGLYDKDVMKVQKGLIKFGIRGDTEKRILTKDETDAIFAALTGYLHLEGLTEEVGDDEGKIVVPRV